MTAKLIFAATLTLAPLWAATAAEGTRPNGSVSAPALEIPFSSLASPGARAHFVAKTTSPVSEAMRGKDVAGMRKVLDDMRFEPAVAMMRKIFPVSITEKKYGGVVTDVVEPEGGVPARNAARVLINVHGGGFVVGARLAGQQESIPIASLGGFKVVTVDYRMAPEHKFPAASEDVAAVYKDLLKQYRPENIGLYGCSAGGILTAQALAWFQTHELPRPGAAGIFGAGGVVGRWGDSIYAGGALAGNTRVPAYRDEDTKKALVYFSAADLEDALVSPAHAPAVMKNFPPTLVMSGTRDEQLSNAVYTHAKLVKEGVDAELHVQEAALHCSFAQPIGDPDWPENREAWNIIVRFFDKHLGAAK